MSDSHTTGNGLPPPLLGLSDIILARDSRRSTSHQHGTETDSKQTNMETLKSYFDSDVGNLLIQIPSHIASSANATPSNDIPSSSSLTQTSLKQVEPVLQSVSIETQSNDMSCTQMESIKTIVSTPPTTAVTLTTVNPSLVIKTIGNRASLSSSTLNADKQTKQQQQIEQQQQIKQRQEVTGTMQEGGSLNRAEGTSLKLAQYTLEDVIEPPLLVTMETDKQSKEEASSKAPESDIVMTTLPSNKTQSDSNSTSNRMESGPQDGSLGSSSKHLSYNFLDTLFTNWPCIVTTILGYYPVGQSTDETSNQQNSYSTIGQLDDPIWSQSSHNRNMSTVQSLDGFTSHLILNCSESCIEQFTTTIVQKINSCLAESSQCSSDLIDINVHDIDLKLIDEKILPILVGKRFLNSVIRVLGMEHSRVKNMFVEMQHFRNQNAAANREVEVGEGQGARVWRGRVWNGRNYVDTSSGTEAVPKNVVKITKLVFA